MRLKTPGWGWGTPFGKGSRKLNLLGKGLGKRGGSKNGEGEAASWPCSRSPRLPVPPPPPAPALCLLSPVSRPVPPPRCCYRGARNRSCTRAAEGRADLGCCERAQRAVKEAFVDSACRSRAAPQTGVLGGEEGRLGGGGGERDCAKWKEAGRESQSRCQGATTRAH